MAVRLREARRGDERAVAAVHVRSWQEAYRELMPAEFLDGLDVGERAQRYAFGSKDERAPTTVLAIDLEVSGEGDGEDPSLTNSREVRSGSSPSPCERIAGFVTFGPSRDEDAEGPAEIYALYVDPENHRSGIGRLLMAEARRRLVELGYSDVVLWVLQGNNRAARFYEGEGWSPDGATRAEQPYGIISKVRRFRRPLP